MADIERDPHARPVPSSAWEADEASRTKKERVEIFNATRPGGLDGWTMDEGQYRAVHDLILEMIDDHADDDGTIGLQAVVEAAQDRYSNHALFPKGRLTNYVRYTKTDMEARCIVERIPPQQPPTHHPVASGINGDVLPIGAVMGRCGFVGRWDDLLW